MLDLQIENVAQFTLRDYLQRDLPSLADIYASSIRGAGPEYYTHPQVAAWAGFAEDIEAFRKWIEEARTLVAVSGNGACIGFSGLIEENHISALFVSPTHQRQGVASMLLGRLLEEARAKGVRAASAHASEFSRPLFGKFGFEVVQLERTEVKGVEMSRYKMYANPFRTQLVTCDIRGGRF